jgi:hypothetical protein
MIDAGYFPKVVALPPASLNVPGVHEICSVSTCISSGPDNWFNQWRHNEFGWFNSVENAWSVVPDSERARHRMFAYRIALTRFRKGEPLEVAVPADAHPAPIPATFDSLGYDAISKSHESVLGFECSPLSCNAMAAEISVNAYCLLNMESSATDTAKAFSISEPEPGDYYVVEVLEAKRV